MRAVASLMELGFKVGLSSIGNTPALLVAVGRTGVSGKGCDIEVEPAAIAELD
jgi:hypothetical protein